MIIERPIMSEKSGELRDSDNQYVFRVDRKAKKQQIKQAIERMFEVKVLRVNSLVMRGQVKRRGLQTSKQPNFKKAYVTLQKGSVIPLFEDN